VINLFQASNSDAVPDHFVRLAILRFLEARLRQPGPSGVSGFHRVGDLLAKLVLLGHDASRVHEELLYLPKKACVLAEHQRLDELSEDDLICLSPGGSVHLEMLESKDYLAACVEDIRMADEAAANRVALRIGGNRHAHLSCPCGKHA
jgi:hypothetical protein